MRARKRFGQHFLHDPAVIQRIVDCIDPQPDQTLVEIGPGTGALTLPLLEHCGRLHVIELDRELAPLLRQQYEEVGTLYVHQADALRFDFAVLAETDGELRLAGNLPYNISTPLLFRVLALGKAVKDMHFMLQREVAQRLTAVPGSKTYGRLTVSASARAQVQQLFDVGPGAFKPAPRVQSSIVRLIPRDPDFEIANIELFDRIVGAAFGQRRKTVANALKGIADRDQIAAAGLNPGARAEQIEAAGFAALTAVLFEPERAQT